MSALTPEELQQLRELLENASEAERRWATSTEQSVKALKEQREAILDKIENLERLRDSADNEYAAALRNNEIVRQRQLLDKTYLDQLNAKIAALETLTPKEEEAHKALLEMVEANKLVNEAQKEGTARAKEAANTFGGAFATSINKAHARMKEFGVAGTLATEGIIGLQKGFDKLYSTTKDLVFQFDSVTKGFEKQFQVGNQYKKTIEDVYRANNIYGVGLEETAKSMGSLVTITTDFTMMTAGQQKMLARTGTILGELGVATDDFAKGMQISMKAYGQSVSQAENTSLELMETARALGVAPGQMAAQYAQMGSQLAKFGVEGTTTFKELSRVQKLTGLEMEKILALTNKFDTFEGAATQAGQLNAALGGNFVNAMDLMMATDPVERFEMMRGALENAGLAFDDMSYYQKQFYAESLGLSDVNDLALMMSGNTDLMANATNKSAKEIEEEAKRAQKQLEIKEKLNAVMLNIAEAFIPVANALDKLAQVFIDNAEAIKHVVNILLIFGGLLTMQKVIGGVLSFGQHLKGATTFMNMFSSATKAGRLATMGLYGVLGTAIYALYKFAPDKLKPVLIGLGLLAGAIFMVKKAMKESSSASDDLTSDITDMAGKKLKDKLLKKAAKDGITDTITDSVTGGGKRSLLSRAGGFLKGGLRGGGGALAAKGALLAGVGYGAYKGAGALGRAVGGKRWYRFGFYNGGALPGSMSPGYGGGMPSGNAVLHDNETVVPGSPSRGRRLLEAPIKKALFSALAGGPMRFTPFGMMASMIGRKSRSGSGEQQNVKLTLAFADGAEDFIKVTAVEGVDEGMKAKILERG